uniref:T-cell surface glycoprotein CD3 zeta chain n=1 Tax=Xiphophorus maculatus TaxID=8083 RepID=A0A3B5QN34_XIPMA
PISDWVAFSPVLFAQTEPLWFCSAVFALALDYSDPKLCYVLDGFLGLYGLIITGMFIKEKVGCWMTPPTRYQTNPPEQNHSDLLDVYLTGSGSGFQGLQKRSEPTYKELPVKREVSGLSSATRDTYDSLQMQPLPAR